MALSADRNTEMRGTGEYSWPVKAATKIYARSLVMRALAAGNYAQPGADTATMMFAGVAIEQADNSSGLAAAIRVPVYRKGQFKFAFSGTATYADIGKMCYLIDDQTVGLVGTASTGTVWCGRIVDVESASVVWIEIDGSADGLEP
jgi:hypothetical protein